MNPNNSSSRNASPTARPAYRGPRLPGDPAGKTAAGPRKGPPAPGKDKRKACLHCGRPLNSKYAAQQGWLHDTCELAVGRDVFTYSSGATFYDANSQPEFRTEGRAYRLSRAFVDPAEKAKVEREEGGVVVRLTESQCGTGVAIEALRTA